jgi:hypothetical protein
MSIVTPACHVVRDEGPRHVSALVADRSEGEQCAPATSKQGRSTDNGRRRGVLGSGPRAAAAVVLVLNSYSPHIRAPARLETIT